MHWIAKFLLVCALFATSHALEGSANYVGKCPAQKSMANFDFNRYQGYWYFLEFNERLAGFGRECQTVLYKDFNPELSTYRDDNAVKLQGKAIKIFGNGTLVPVLRNRTLFLGDYYKPLIPPTENNSEIVEHFQLTFKINGFVLDTDYETYTIEWDCDETGKLPWTYSESVWIGSRKREYLPGAKEKAYQVLRDIGFTPEKFFKVDQSNCSDTDDILD